VLEHVRVGATGDLAHTQHAALAALHESWEREQMPPHGGELDRAVGIVLDTIGWMKMDARDVLGVEYRFDLATPSGTLYIGYADLVVRTGEDSAEVRDYKVTSSVRDAYELQYDQQGNMYGWAVREVWPWVENVSFAHVYPPVLREVRVQLTSDTIADALAVHEASVEMVESETEYRPRAGEHCEHCAFSDGCPALVRVPAEQLEF
jgi:RecB family exonuclease